VLLSSQTFNCDFICDSEGKERDKKKGEKINRKAGRLERKRMGKREIGKKRKIDLKKSL